MSLSEEIQMIAPSHLNFVLSILTNDLIQSEIDRVSHFFLSFRPEGLTPKDSSSDVIPILYCTAARRAARRRRLSLQILHLLTPPSNSNGLQIIFVFTRISAAQTKAESLFQLHQQKIFIKGGWIISSSSVFFWIGTSIFLGRSDRVDKIHPCSVFIIRQLPIVVCLDTRRVAFDRCWTKAAIDKLE